MENKRTVETLTEEKVLKISLDFQDLVLPQKALWRIWKEPQIHYLLPNDTFIIGFFPWRQTIIPVVQPSILPFPFSQLKIEPPFPFLVGFQISSFPSNLKAALPATKIFGFSKALLLEAENQNQPLPIAQLIDSNEKMPFFELSGFFTLEDIEFLKELLSLG
ncbi:MAG: hypothetical protein D6785_01715 [Planctomycetota bacterium]|nr:MAG: hypothetical protein D6785_01715 [Planctomycetota bacterium]